MLISKKFSGGLNGVSVFNNSNIILSSTEDNLGGIRSNSYLKFNNSDTLFTILSSKKILLAKDFTSLGNRQIKLDSDIGLKIQNDDSIRLIYDEYEVDYVFDIKNGGNGYVAKDVLSLKGGDLSLNSFSEIGSPAEFVITDIDNDGGIIKNVEIKNRGKYCSPPDDEVELIGGFGHGAKFKVQYRKTESQQAQEKVVKNVVVKDGATILTLDYSISPGIKSGRISFEKWEIILSNPYIGDSQTNLGYKIFSESTPHYSIPLTIKNNSDFDLIYNQAVNRMDSLIKEVNNRIDEIEKKIISS